MSIFSKAFKKLETNIKTVGAKAIKANTQVIKAGISIVAGRLAGGAAGGSNNSNGTNVPQPALAALRETAANTVTNFLTPHVADQPAAVPGLPGGGGGPASLNRRSGNVKQVGNSAPPLGVGLGGIDNRILWGAIAVLLGLWFVVRKR